MQQILLELIDLLLRYRRLLVILGPIVLALLSSLGHRYARPDAQRPKSSFFTEGGYGTAIDLVLGALAAAVGHLILLYNRLQSTPVAKDPTAASDLAKSMMGTVVGLSVLLGVCLLVTNAIRQYGWMSEQPSTPRRWGPAGALLAGLIILGATLYLLTD